MEVSIKVEGKDVVVEIDDSPIERRLPGINFYKEKYKNKPYRDERNKTLASTPEVKKKFPVNCESLSGKRPFFRKGNSITNSI